MTQTRHTRRLGLRIERETRLGVTSKHWILRRMVNGRRVRFPLGPDTREAERLAEEIESFLSLPSSTLDEAVARYIRKRPDRVATIGECMAAYEGALHVIGLNGGAVSRSSFEGYRSFMRTFLRRVLAARENKPFESVSGKRAVDYSPWDGLPTTFLTGRAVQDFKKACMEEVGDDGDEEEILTAKISANTCLRNARALFSVAARRYYERVNLVVAPLDEFLSEPDFPKATKFFQLLPAPAIVRIFADAAGLKTSAPDVYRMFFLCVHAGLRAGEAAAFSLSWIREEDTPKVFVQADGKFNPKHGHGRKVSIQTWVRDEIQAIGPVRTPDKTADELNAWLRANGVTESVSKPTHELRKLWFSAKVKSDGLLAAQQQGGHRDPKITATNYANNQMPDFLLGFWRTPVSEAVKDPEVSRLLKTRQG